MYFGILRFISGFYFDFSQASSVEVKVEPKAEPSVEEAREKNIEPSKMTLPVETPLPVSSNGAVPMNGHESKADEEQNVPQDLISGQSRDQWFSPDINGRRPAARYQVI